jgi:hypothetical protein
MGGAVGWGGGDGVSAGLEAEDADEELVEGGADWVRREEREQCVERPAERVRDGVKCPRVPDARAGVERLQVQLPARARGGGGCGAAGDAGARSPIGRCGWRDAGMLVSRGVDDGQWVGG